MICVGAPGLGPAFLEDRPDCGIHDLVGGALGAFELANRLLRKNDFESGISQSLKMRRPGDAEAITEPEAVVEAKRLRPCGLADQAQNHGVLVVEVTKADVKTRLGLKAVADKLAGETGTLSGPRLYFEIREGSGAVDPADWLRAPLEG